MPSFTLDTNCMIAVDEDRPEAEFVRQLLRAKAEGAADVAMVASSASERQKGDAYLESIDLFKDRMCRLGFGRLPLLMPLARYGVSFWDHGLWADDSAVALEELIYTTLFPNSAYCWEDFARRKNIDPAKNATVVYFRWRNQILDAQAFWAHEHNGRDIFVTTDARFKVLEGTAGLSHATIRIPGEAAAMIA